MTEKFHIFSKSQKIYSLYLAVSMNLALGLYPSSNVFYLKQRFGNWLCFRLQVKRGEGEPTLWGP
jgi:hypothetical protein